MVKLDGQLLNLPIISKFTVEIVSLFMYYYNAIQLLVNFYMVDISSNLYGVDATCLCECIDFARRLLLEALIYFPFY